MRVLHLLSSPVFSGAAEAVALLAGAQRKAGTEVSVAVDRTRAGTGSEEPAAPRFEALELLDDRGLLLSTRGGLWRVLGDARRIRRLDVDVLHCHASHDHWLAWLGRPTGARIVRSFHAPRSLRRGAAPADAMTVPVAELLPRLPPAAPSMVLPAMVDTTLFRPGTGRVALRRALELPAGPVVGMASTFQASRQHDLALAGFAELLVRVPEATLVLLGDGVLEADIKARVRSLGLEKRVRLPGYQRGAELVRWLQALDELWVFGLGNDWAGRTALQARACGVRVVAAPLGALPRWADVVLGELTPGAVARAALGTERRPAAVPDVKAVASEVLALYRSAGARG
jgi:L-malate glycosyltransferase